MNFLYQTRRRFDSRLYKAAKGFAALFGYDLTPKHFYSPIPEAHDLARVRWEREAEELGGIDWREAEQLALLERMASRREELGNFPREGHDDVFVPPARNGTFLPPDFDTLYLLMRELRPRRIVEVGSGISTLLMLKAMDRNREDGAGSRLVSVDPYPGPAIEVSSEQRRDFRLVPKRIQRMPISFFQKLRSGDMLFIDSSHCAKAGSDVNSLFFDVLPNLAPGVIVHFHDITLPNDYLKQWVTRDGIFWNEQYVLHAFLQYNGVFEVVFGTNFMRLRHPERMKASLFHYDDTSEPGGSFYIRRKKGEG